MRFFYLTILAILIALSGCTMHPPSASGFMETAEQGQNDEKVRVLTARAEKINFSLSGDEWNIPIALEPQDPLSGGCDPDLFPDREARHWLRQQVLTDPWGHLPSVPC